MTTLIVFDSDCLLCNGWVKFLLRHDHARIFRFASIQSDFGRRLLAEHELPFDDLETLLVIDGARSYQHTDAIFEVLRQLGWPWKLLGLARLIPAPLRDRLYRHIARNRIRYFGRPSVCLIPSLQDSDRFL